MKGYIGEACPDVGEFYPGAQWDVFEIAILVGDYGV